MRSDDEKQRSGEEQMQVRGISRRGFLTRSGFLIVGAAGGASFLAACSRNAGPQNQATVGGTASPRSGGTIRIALSGDPNTLDPIIDPGRPGFGIMVNSMDGLLNRGPEYTEIVPGLSPAMPDQPDPLTYAFTLREGLKFHTGDPVTLDDVVFTYTRLIDPDYEATAGSVYQENIEDISIEGDTIVFRMAQEWPLFPAFVSGSHTHIVQRSVVEEAGDEFGHSVFSGTGPFEIIEWERGDHITIARTDVDTNSPRGEPHLDEAIYHVVPEATSRRSALQSGEVDVMYDPLFRDISQFEDSDEFIVSSAPSSTMSTVVFNTGMAPMDDQRVRRALSLGVDRQELVDSFFYGYASIATDMFTPFHWAHDDSIGVPYDPDQARELLAEAGYDESTPLEFTLLVDTRNPIFTEQATAMQARWEDIGVRMEIAPTAYSAITESLFGPPDEWAAPAAFTRLQPLRGTAYEFAYQLYGSAGPFNLSNFNTPDGDENQDLEDALLEADDYNEFDESEREASIPVYAEASRLLNEEAPVLILNWWDIVDIVSNRVHGWQVANNDINLLTGVSLEE